MGDLKGLYSGIMPVQFLTSMNHDVERWAIVLSILTDLTGDIVQSWVHLVLPETWVFVVLIVLYEVFYFSSRIEILLYWGN